MRCFSVALFLNFALCAALWIPCAQAGENRPARTEDAAIAKAMGAPYYSGAVIPRPREAEYGDEVVVLADGMGLRTLYRLDFEYQGPARKLAMRLLAARLQSYTEQFAGAWKAGGGGALPITAGLVTDDGVSSALRRLKLKRQAKGLPAQGYVLHIGPEEILCAGKDNTGVLNAVASLIQLMHVKDGKLVAPHARIVDWPTFEVRYTAEYWLPGTEFFDWMMLQKINGFGACYRAMSWGGLTDEVREGLRRIGEYTRGHQTMHFMVQFHVGGRGKQHRVIDCGDPAQVERLIQTIRETISLTPVQHLMICYDDVKPEFQPKEKGRFAHPAEAHGVLMDTVYRVVKDMSPDTVVSFCSPNYQGLQHRRWRKTNPELPNVLEYMKYLRAWKNREVRIVWTGPVTESRWIKQKDLDLYYEQVSPGRKLMYWDNTWHYHQPLRNFHAQYLDGFVDHCSDRTSYINVNGVGVTGRFFATSANDYYWHPEGFDSKAARRQAVAQFMGPAAVPAAEAFYELRGEDYNVFFSRDVDLAAFDKVLRDLAAVSLNDPFDEACRSVYDRVAKKRAEAEKKKTE